jgi:hypothetical protein
MTVDGQPASAGPMMALRVAAIVPVSDMPRQAPDVAVPPGEAMWRHAVNRAGRSARRHHFLPDRSLSSVASSTPLAVGGPTSACCGNGANGRKPQSIGRTGRVG